MQAVHHVVAAATEVVVELHVFGVQPVVGIRGVGVRRLVGEPDRDVPDQPVPEPMSDSTDRSG